MADQEIVVLRYGHRIVRDARVTSHCCLVARAFGAGKVIVEGVEDKELKNSVQEIVQKWGGDFQVEFANDWRKILEEYKKKGFKVVHLTMYGFPVKKKLKELINQDKLLVLVGSQKVVKEVYQKADYNLSVTLQPHSEIGALGVFLYLLNGEGVLEKTFPKARLKVKPSEHEKLLFPESCE